MRFKIISNPPYQDYMDIVTFILKRNADKENIYLIPLKWSKEVLKYVRLSQKYKNFISFINSFLFEVDDYKIEQSNEFDVKFDADCGIVSINTKFVNKETIEAICINKIFSKIKELNFLKDLKFLNYKKDFKNFIVFKSTNTSLSAKYIQAQTSVISTYGMFIGGKDCNGNTLEKAKELNRYSTVGSIENTTVLVLDTPQECKNCLDSFNLTISKFVSIITGFDRHAYPYLWNFAKDYKQPLTNKYFVDLYNIDGYVSETKGEKNSEWEYILKYVQAAENYNAQQSKKKACSNKQAFKTFL